MRDFTTAAMPALDELYHGNSKHSPTRLGFVHAAMMRRRDRALHGFYEANKNAFKTYGAARIITLPPPCPVRPLSVLDAIAARRSQRTFGAATPSLDALATLLAAGYGVHGERGGMAARAVPSGGGLYPLELYVLQLAAGPVANGVYHYHPGRHCLQAIRNRCDRGAVERASIYPDIIAQAPVVLALTADLPRTRAKYGERGYRLALLEAGHVSQNLYLIVQALDLAIVALDGFYDDRVHALLDVDGVSEIALVLFAVGHPR
jgi:SagB-type dehydrogenase family enzyme